MHICKWNYVTILFFSLYVLPMTQCMIRFKSKSGLGFAEIIFMAVALRYVDRLLSFSLSCFVFVTIFNFIFV